MDRLESEWAHARSSSSWLLRGCFAWQGELLYEDDGTARPSDPPAQIASILALLLVAVDLVFSFLLYEDYPAYALGINYGSTAFFVAELSLRFYCYAYLARSDGCDWGDLDFFLLDKTRAVDLVAVILDVLSLVIILAITYGQTWLNQNLCAPGGEFGALLCFGINQAVGIVPGVVQSIEHYVCLTHVRRSGRLDPRASR